MKTNPFLGLLLFNLNAITVGTLMENVCVSTDQSTNENAYPSKEQPGNLWTQNALAVVPYEDNNILPLLHKEERDFVFAGRKLVIRQEWDKLGVAAVVWDAAVILCQYLDEHRDLIKGKSVLELGAGTGLVGMVAALLGGAVSITDREIVLDYLKTVVHDNLPDLSIDVRALDWTQDRDKFGNTYDIILGADIVYVEEVFQDLLNTLIQLSSKETLILLSCRVRYDRDTNFLQMLEEVFTVMQIFYDEKTDIKIFKVVKR